MKAITLTLVLLAGLPLAVSAQVTKEDIKKLTAAGISDDVILSYVKSNGGIGKLSAEDVVDLKQAGASEKLLTSILSNSSPAPQKMVERPAGTPPAPAPAPVADTAPYYSTPSTVVYPDYYPSSYYTYYYPYYWSYPRYYYSSCYPRSYYYAPGIRAGFSTGHYYGRGSVGVSVYRR
jgi:hypothetical protein